MRKPDRPTSGVILRCAIYTRKSSEEGLEQEFNSLDAQREACEAFVKSQRHAGWVVGMDKGRIASLCRLSYLAPDIVRALLEGRQPIELTPTRLRRLSKDLPHDWREQRRFLGFSDRES